MAYSYEYRAPNCKRCGCHVGSAAGLWRCSGCGATVDAASGAPGPSQPPPSYGPPREVCCNAPLVRQAEAERQALVERDHAEARAVAEAARRQLAGGPSAVEDDAPAKARAKKEKLTREAERKRPARGE